MAKKKRFLGIFKSKRKSSSGGSSGVKKGKRGGGLKKLLNITTFAPLLPFRAAMKLILRSKGVKPKDKIDELSQQFYKIVIKKENYSEIEHIEPTIISAIVTAVLAYFKNLKKKKEEGKELTESEKKALDVAEKSVDTVVRNIKEEAKAEIREKSFTPLLITAAVSVVLVFLAFSTKKSK